MNGDIVFDLGKMVVNTGVEETTLLIGNVTIRVKNSLSIGMDWMEVGELVLKTGTESKEIELIEEDVMMLQAMSNLRNKKKMNLAKVNGDPPSCWTSRHSWHADEEELDRCIRIEGECSGSCPNLGWGDPLCFGLMDVNPYISSNHLTGNIVHLNPDSVDETSYSYRVETDDGVVLVIRSQDEFSDNDIQLAMCEIRKMVLDPIKEEEMVAQVGKIRFDLPLPSSDPAIRHLGQLGEYLKLDKALDDRLYQQVVVKEIIAGIPPPAPMQLLQTYPRGGSTDMFEHEFCPAVREPWMANCNAEISDIYDYTPLKKICAKVIPIVKYPDLTSLKGSEKIIGKRFDVTYESTSGVVDNIIPKAHKYNPVKEIRKMEVAKKTLVTNMVMTNMPGLRSKYTAGKNRRVCVERDKGMMVLIMYTIAMIGCIMPVSETQFICGDDKHGTLWTLPNIEDCEIDASMGVKITADVFTKEYDYNVTMHRCYYSERVDKTTYGFFGPKSHLSSYTEYRPMRVEDCIKLKDTKQFGDLKLKRVSTNSWSTGILPNIEYSWCCSDTITTTSNMHLEEVTARVHLVNGYAVLVSADADVSHCSYGQGNYSSPTSTYVWEPLNVTCNIKHAGAGEFTVLADGHWLSYEMQLSLMVSGSDVYCGINYTTTEQGLLVIERSRIRRDVDAGEKNFVLKAANQYSKSLYNNNYLHLCTVDRLIGNYMYDMARTNPTRYVRAYFNKHNIAAKFVGDAILVWECMNVEILSEMRGHKYMGVCYDMMPVKYEYNRQEKMGFLDRITGEIIPVSSTHDCSSVSGYLIHDGEWRKYYDNVKYDVVQAVQRIPANSAHMNVKEVSFINNHLHSVYGPLGSRYREALVSDFIALGAKHLIDNDVECNEEIDTRISGMLKDTKEAMRNAVFYPIKMGIVVLIIVLVVYLAIRYGILALIGQKIKHKYNTVRYRKSDGEVIVVE
uniref:Putative glycoprotein n=1 Tax=Keturi virus TaxID=2800922 RepID=A0A894KNI7_9VIRU|nr:MAG: putative glycoprotein [Keturi virus]